MEEIQFTVPMDPTRLRQLASTLTTIADTLQPSAPGPEVFAPAPQAAPAPAAPQAAPAPAAPAAPQAAPAPQAPAADVDSAGIPWDSRIHSGGKGKLKNGRWKRKRGADKALADSIESAYLPAAPAPAAPQALPKTFPEFMLFIQKQHIDPNAILAACNKHDIQSLPLLATKPDKIPLVAGELMK